MELEKKLFSKEWDKRNDRKRCKIRSCLETGYGAGMAYLDL